MINYENIAKEKINLSLVVDDNITIKIISTKDVSLKYLNWLKSHEIIKFTEQNKKNILLNQPKFL